MSLNKKKIQSSPNHYVEKEVAHFNRPVLKQGGLQVVLIILGITVTKLEL